PRCLGSVLFPYTTLFRSHPRLKRIYGNQIIKKYKFFDDFYGIDETVMKIVRYFHSAAMMGEESRQVLYLVGPVGAGKSSIMEALDRKSTRLNSSHVKISY